MILKIINAQLPPRNMIKKNILGVTEQAIQKGIIDYLKIKKYVVFKHRNVGIYKKATGSYIPLPDGEKGISDIIGCSPEGRFIAIEVKKPDGKPTQNQIDFIDKIKASGGIAFFAYSLAEAMESLENYPRSN